MINVGIVYPNDPFGPKVGGPETFLKGFIRYSPEDFGIRYVGMTVDTAARPVRQWREESIGGKRFRFMPAMAEPDENKKTAVPVSFRFTASLLMKPVDLSGCVLLFDRIEPAFAYRWSGLPQIGVIHNDLSQWLKKGQSEVIWSKFPRVYRKYESWIFGAWNKVYSVSEKTLSQYAELYPQHQGKFGFLPTWVDENVFFPATEDRAAIRRRLAPREDPAAPWVIFVGRFQQQKAPGRVMEAFAAHSKLNPRCQYFLIGEGNLKNDAMVRALQLGLGQKAFFAGDVPQDKLADYYRAADALLLASNFEGMPRSVLESLGSGTPVVTTDVGEVRKVVRNGKNGEIIEGFEPEALAAALEKVLSAPERYTARECLDGVAPYRPKLVLEPLYRAIRDLSAQKKNP